VLISCCNFNDIPESRNEYWFPNELRRTCTKPKLLALVGAPRVDISVNCYDQRVLIATAHLLDELVFERGQDSWIQHFLSDWLLGKVSIRVQAQLALSIRAPCVDYSMQISFVYTAVVSVEY
jgi:hypothetical protein